MVEPNQRTSPIVAMHVRYEAVQRAYDAAEQAERVARTAGDTDQFAFERAMKTITEESDALSHAILFQVPDTWTDAMILHFHAINAADLLANGAEPATDLEKETLITALDTLFDFVCGEINADQEALGTSFQASARRARLLRRQRTGEVGADR